MYCRDSDPVLRRFLDGVVIKLRLALWLLTAIAALGGTGYGTWWVTDQHAQNKAKDIEIATQNVTIAMTMQYGNDMFDRNKLIHDGVAQNAKDALRTNDLLLVLRKLRLQHSDSACPAAKGSQNTDTLGTSGVAAYDNGGRINESIAVRCAALNNAVRQRNVEEGFAP